MGINTFFVIEKISANNLETGVLLITILVALLYLLFVIYLGFHLYISFGGKQLESHELVQKYVVVPDMNIPKNKI